MFRGLTTLCAVSAVTAITALPAVSSAAPAGFTYKDRSISASLNGPANPAAGLPTVDLITGTGVDISASDILTYRAAGFPALDASASLTGGWLGCDTATDELVNVTYNGSSPLPEGSVTVSSKLSSGSLAATWPVQVTVEWTPSCSTPDFGLSSTAELSETVHVELAVVSDGSPSTSSTQRDPSTGDRMSTTSQSGQVVRVLLDGETYVPDWAEDAPYAVAAGLSSTAYVQRS